VELLNQVVTAETKKTAAIVAKPLEHLLGRIWWHISVSQIIKTKTH
jgi:hypothetical protein